MKSGERFRVATFNMWGAGLPYRYWTERSVVRGALPDSAALAEADESVIWDRRLALMRRELALARPDLIALQEVVGSPGATETRADELARALASDGEYEVALSNPGPTNRLAVLSRLPILAQSERQLASMSGAFGGFPSVFEVVVSWGTVWVVHIPVGPEEVRAACIAEVAVAADAFGPGPLVVCGDFNCPTDGRPMRGLLAVGRLADSWLAAGGHPDALTMPMPGPTWRLDYILHRTLDGIRPAPRPELFGTEPDERGAFASDHCGVVVEFSPR